MINYNLIFKSQEYYKKLGYTIIEVPWLVKEEDITNTFEVKYEYNYKLKDTRCLVGSAEQSFIKLMLEEDLNGKYQAVTPCFREDIQDELHREYFIKNEIFIRLEGNVSYNNILNKLLQEATKFFNSISLYGCSILKIEEDCFDINIKGIEVGSYGIRTLIKNGREYKWIYGTGLAEPRFSMTQTKGEV